MISLLLKTFLGCQAYSVLVLNSAARPKKNVKIRAYSKPLIREIAEKQIRWVIVNS